MRSRLREGTASPWLLIPILAVAGWLRFWNLTGKGLIYWDEGKFCLEGLRLLAGLERLVGQHANFAAGKSVGTAKATHALLIALSYAVLGVHDYSPLILDALCSLATVAVVYAFASRLFDPTIGLVASLLLAVSGYDVLYARSALSESDANLLFAGGVLLWAFSWQRDGAERWLPTRHPLSWRLLAALAMGAAFTTNYRTLVCIAVVVGVDLVLAMKNQRMLSAAATWAVGLAVFPLAWQVIGLAANARGYILFRNELTYRPTSYLAEAVYQIHQGKQAVFRFDPSIYIQWYVARQGGLVSLVLAGGLVLTAIRRTTSLVVPALLVAVPYAVYAVAPFIVPRNLDTAVPFACTLSAAALVFAVERVRVQPWLPALVLAGVVLILSLAGGVLAWRWTAVRSGFAQASRYLGMVHAPGAMTHNEVMMFYLRDSEVGCRSVPSPRHLKGLLSASDIPYPYLVVDVYDTDVARYLLAHGRRVARFLVVGTQSLGENPVASENGSPPGPHQDQHVDVYRAPSYRPPAQLPPCSLDRVAPG